MDVTLIQPRLGASGVKGSMPPLAMGILAKHTPSEYSLQFFDENIEDLPENLVTDLIALSVTTLTARRAYEIADYFCTQNIPVVMGGIHPTMLPEEALKHATSVVKGIGELIWPKVLEDAKNHCLQKIYEGENKTNLSGLTPDRTIFENKKYSVVTPVQFGRGCPYTCDFCSVHTFYGTEIRHRPVEEVIDEISKVKSKIIFIVDDNIYTYGKASTEFLEKLAKLKITWIGQASVNVAKNPETVRLLKKSGCIGLIIGFESMETTSLSEMGKNVNIQNDYTEAVDMLQKHGIMIAGSFVFGYRNENKDTVKKAIDFALQKNFVHAYFNPLVPTPGTALYTRVFEEGRFTEPVWWLSDTFKYGTLPYIPEGVNTQEIENACISARLKFDSIRSIFKRTFSSRSNWLPLSNLFFFLLANFTYRKEYMRKYGKTLIHNDSKH